jgi:hypothetical protein
MCRPQHREARQGSGEGEQCCDDGPSPVFRACPPHDRVPYQALCPAEQLRKHAISRGSVKAWLGKFPRRRGKNPRLPGARLEPRESESEDSSESLSNKEPQRLTGRTMRITKATTMKVTFMGERMRLDPSSTLPRGPADGERSPPPD